MVRKRRLIYRMTSFDYRKVFGVTGNVPGMTNGFREFTGGGQPTPGKPIGLGGGAPALSGLVGQPKRALCAIGKKIKEKRKKGGGGKEGKDSSHQTKLDSVWRGSPPPLARPTPLGLLEPQGKAPLPPSYIYGGFRADLRQLFHGSPTTYLHGFSSRSRFCGARAEPC